MEIVKIEFALEGEAMVVVEEVERECRSWSIKRRGIPANPQQLAVIWYPARSFFAVAVLDSQVVDTVDVNNEQ